MSVKKEIEDLLKALEKNADVVSRAFEIFKTLFVYGDHTFFASLIFAEKKSSFLNEKYLSSGGAGKMKEEKWEFNFHSWEFNFRFPDVPSLEDVQAANTIISFDEKRILTKDNVKIQHDSLFSIFSDYISESDDVFFKTLKRQYLLDIAIGRKMVTSDSLFFPTKDEVFLRKYSDILNRPPYYSSENFLLISPTVGQYLRLLGENTLQTSQNSYLWMVEMYFFCNNPFEGLAKNKAFVKAFAFWLKNNFNILDEGKLSKLKNFVDSFYEISFLENKERSAGSGFNSFTDSSFYLEEIYGNNEEDS